MNKFLSNIFNRKDKWIKFIFYIFDAVISILSILVIPNKMLSVIFIIGILFINIISLNRDKIVNLESLFNGKVKNIFFTILFIWALVPSLVGALREKANLWELMFSNAIPNILGALIVYSFVKHISEFGYKDFVIKILQTDYVIGSIIKIFYYFCFFNSATYFFNESVQDANIINNIYLFIVILSGLIVGCAFFYRIFLDDRAFDSSPKKVYPVKTLYCGAAYLVSCSLPSYFIEVKIEPILLILNTITAFITALVLLGIVIRKSDKKYNEYPFVEFGAFTLIIIINCCFYLAKNVENLGDIIHQLINGGGVLIAVILGLYILNKEGQKQEKEQNKEQNKKQEKEQDLL